MPRHHIVVRVTHWVNVVALTLMVGSGLRIFNAHPAFARIGERFCCYPFEGKPIPGWLTFGGWLAGARNWHFAMMWLLVVNGLAYLAFIYLHGEWRELVPRRGDARDAWEMVKYYASLRLEHPAQGKYNALQKSAYFSMPLVGALAVLTGLAIWKPVQLSPLTNAMGGYVWARYFHFLAMLAIVALALGHVFMVFVVEPGALWAMITGRPRNEEERAPRRLAIRRRAATSVAGATPAPEAPVSPPWPVSSEESVSPVESVSPEGPLSPEEPVSPEGPVSPDEPVSPVAAPMPRSAAPSPVPLSRDPAIPKEG